MGGGGAARNRGYSHKCGPVRWCLGHPTVSARTTACRGGFEGSLTQSLVGGCSRKGLVGPCGVCSLRRVLPRHGGPGVPRMTGLRTSGIQTKWPRAFIATVCRRVVGGCTGNGAPEPWGALAGTQWQQGHGSRMRGCEHPKTFPVLTQRPHTRPRCRS